ncbi:MAG: hypothetical protein JNM10_17465 [Planctomycetia bacterium]|nr:hypothetical protein [Planctomycetia bacterium]
MSGGHSSGGHDQSRAHGHDAHGSHGGGHDGGHGGGHGAHASHGGGHGSTEIPPAPESRWISPARRDFEQPWAGGLLLWPVVWTVIAVLFGLLAQRHTGHVALPGEHHAGAGH